LLVTSAPRTARTLFYRAFYRLPHSVRRRLVRVAVPKYIVGAVSLVRDSEATGAGRMVLVRQPPGHSWGLPAGLLERRERPAVGAARELFEETGIRVPPSRMRPAVPNAIVHLEGWVDTVFEAEVPASTTTLVADGAEVLEVGWFPLDDLPRLSRATARVLAHYGIGPFAAEFAAAEVQAFREADEAAGALGG
jgi:8-oxo-dGTP pyrophosphatase MutT (NUDIX family)